MNQGAFLKLIRAGLAFLFIAQLIFINYLLFGQQSGGQNVQMKEVVRAGIGRGPEALGVFTPQEASPEGPMSFAVSPAGEIYVLDQLNSRIQVFKEGRKLKSIPIPGETYCDLEIMPDGRIALLDNLVKEEVVLLNPQGRPEERISLRRAEIPEPAAITGLYCRSQGRWPGLWAEVENGFILLAGLDGQPAAGFRKLPGLLSQNGRRFLKMEIIDDRQVRLFRSEEDFETWKNYDLNFELPLGVIYGPWEDRAGNLYLGAHTFDEENEACEMVILTPLGRERGRIKLALSSSVHEMLKPILVTPDGLIYQMVIETENKSVVIRQYKMN